MRTSVGRPLMVLTTCVLALCLPSTALGAGLPSGLTAAYSFDEGFGPTAGDGSGNGSTGAISGASWTAASHYGGALDFNGTDNYVDLGNPVPLRFTGSATWAAWVRADSTPADDGQIISKAGTTNGTMSWQFKTSPDTGPHTFAIGVSGTGSAMTQRYSRTVRALGTWYHVAGVYNATARTLDIYVNGVLDNGVLSGTVPASIFDSPTSALIGRRSPGDFYFGGAVDEAQIYNRALTASEIQTVMNTPIESAANDSQPPSEPGPPAVAPMSNARIDLSWNPASDNVRVAGYRVERCQGAGCSNFTEIAAPIATSFTDTTVSASTTYRYRVRAFDGAPNLGPYSQEMAATTVSGASAISNDVVVQNLNFVPAMRFLPGGKKLMGEIAGTLRVVQPGATQPDATPFLVVPNAVAEADAGMNDFTIDPDFTTNRFVYVFYDHRVGSSYRDRVSRFTAAADFNTADPTSEVVLWEDDAATTTGSHHGASLAFGPDGKLYISTGDNGSPPDSQLLTSYHGKVLRINPNGTIPSDNPFVDGSGPNHDEIWVYGLRNPYRMTFEPASGRLYVADVGGNTPASSIEELELIARGANYGWPLCEGPCNSSGVTSPVYSYSHAGRDAAIMGGFFYTGTQYPAGFRGSYFFADYAQNWLKRITFDATGTKVTGVFNVQPLDGALDNTQLVGDPVQLHQGPDGAIYYLDLSFDEQASTFNAGTLRRLQYLGTGNGPPTVVAAATPLEGQPPLQVDFSSAGTVDPEGDPLSYSWDFGDGGTSTQPSPTHTYSASGRYLATVTVSDGSQTSFKSLTISVGNRPTGQILTPSDGTLFRAGQRISITGDGTDPEDGSLPDSAFSWTVVFHHDTHIHPAIGPVNGVRSLNFDIPESGHDFSGNTRYEVILKVTDSTGLQHTSSVFIVPDKVNVSVDTVPSGLTVELDGISRTTPFVYDGLKGFRDTVNAPAQASGGTAYSFASWSDGGAQSHQITVPDTDQSLVARFQAAAAPAPAAAYGFDEGAGAVLGDSSGNGNNGTISGATWTTSGKFGNALSFNGSSNYVDLGNQASLRTTGSMTWSAWVYATGTPLDDGQIVAKSGDGNGWQFKTSPDTGLHTFAVGVSTNGSTNVQRYSTTVRALNTWYHVAGVYDAPAQKLDIYVNGVLDNGVLRGTIPTAQFDPNLNASIGRRSGGFYFQGRIDELRIYKAALTATQVQAVMSAPVNPPGADTQPPTAPSGLTATAVSPTQINLNWNPATDNVGVTGYRVERCQGASCSTFAQIGTPTATSFNDTGLTAGTSYSYRVRAVDAVPNPGPYSTTATTSTPAAPDTQPPSAPSGLTATAVSASQINLSWTAATDNVGVTGYRVERCQGASCSTFAQISTPTATSYNDTGLSAGTSYSYRVRAVDAVPNLGPYSGTATTSTPAAPDTQPPTAPTGLTATAVSQTQINLNWNPATDNVAVTGYRVERCQGASCSTFAQIGTPTATSFNDTGLTAGTSYSYRVRAVDAVPNLGPYSTTATTSTPSAPDTQPPTAPSGLTATAVSSSQISLSWTAATDNVGVTGYRVERCQGASCSTFAQIGTPTATSYNDTGLTAGTSYSYRVRAVDAVPNLGPYSTTATTSTPTGNSGLVAAYSFDEGAGTAVGDSSGSGNNGTLSGPTWTTAGKYGSALVFNGTNALVTIPDAPSLRLTSAMTLEAWVSLQANTNNWRDAIFKGDDNYYLMATTSQSGRPAGGAIVNGQHLESFGAAKLALNTWAHLAATFDGTTMRLFVNGVQVSTKARTGSMATSANPLQLGGDSIYGQYFRGTMDDVRVYNVARSQAQIQADMNTPLQSSQAAGLAAMRQASILDR